MNAQAQHVPLPAIGTPFEGGFLAGLFRLNGSTYAMIVSPKAQGELEEAAWGPYGENIPGAQSYNDGLANTQAMAKAGSDLARWMLALDIGGFSDWYLPSCDELEIIYRNLKPTAYSNYVYRHGENPSSVPVGYPYTENSPTQTAVEAFRHGGAEALEDEWYWSSSQFSADNAWGQHFGDGGQGILDKPDEGRARAVRRLLIP
jgi:hypothetical protein